MNFIAWLILGLVMAGTALLLVVLPAFWKWVISKAPASTAASPTAGKVGVAVDKVGDYTQYATGHAALFTLRCIDFGNANLDISPELTAIDAKLAKAMKKVIPPPTPPIISTTP